jgi:hypothetical protein
MKYSLLNVMSENDGMVDGYWIQDHTGTMETAIALANETNKANGSKLIIAIVDQLPGSII